MLQLARRLRTSYQFTFVYLGDPGALSKELHDEHFPVYIISRRPGRECRCSRRLVNLLERERIDLVHAHQSIAFYHGLTARLFYRRPPLLFTEHERQYPDNRSHTRVTANRMLLESRDRIMASGQFIRQALVLNEGLPPQQVGVIYNGMAPSMTADAPGNVQSIRQEVGVAADAFLILQIARFDPLQDHPLAIRTLEQVVRCLPKARLALVGEGPDKGIIQEMVRERGLESHVLFLGPSIDNARLLAAADLFLLTSIYEDIPPVLIQALAAGRPVVATRVGGVGEIVEDRICGLLVCSGDYGALAEHICRLGEDTKLRERLGGQGRRRFRSMFSEENTAVGYSKLYREMLSQ